MPFVKLQTPNSEHNTNVSELREKFTVLCINCGNNVTFFCMTVISDVRLNKYNNINGFKSSFPPVECCTMDNYGYLPSLS
jgi:hypothetical protein